MAKRPIVSRKNKYSVLSGNTGVVRLKERVNALAPSTNPFCAGKVWKEFIVQICASVMEVVRARRNSETMVGAWEFTQTACGLFLTSWV